MSSATDPLLVTMIVVLLLVTLHSGDIDVATGLFGLFN